MFLSTNDAKDISDRLLALSKAESCVVEISGGVDRSLRFARGAATTNMTTSEVTVQVTSYIGRRKGAVGAASLDAADLEYALRRSEEIAQLLPVDPEYVDPLGPQNYSRTLRYDEAAASEDLAALARMASVAIEESALRDVNSFGCASSGRRFRAFATSSGLFAYDRRSDADFSVTARNRSDSWSGWSGASALHSAKIDAFGVARRAVEKAAYDAPPRELEPAQYTVIFEPAATAELARWLMWTMSARPSDEGRSFFSTPGGGTKQGEALFDPKLTIRSDPEDELAPEGAYGFEGLPQSRRLWIDKGVLASLYRSRFWALRTNAEAIPFAGNFAIDGGETSLEDMIRATKRGVLVTRLWYTNMVDPRSLLLTGLTRDGNFLIENGRITAPLRNMRFNESLASLFSRIDAIGPTERTWRSMSGGVVAAPPILVPSFTFSSKSSGI
jgi:predicted Zn-dependent protease